MKFHYDPVACAVAVGWPGAVVDEINVAPELVGDVLHWRRDPAAPARRVLVDLDGERFAEDWLAAVEAAQR